MASKQHSLRVACAVSLLALLVAPGSAVADPTVVLAGPGDLTGSETVIPFDDQGLAPGDAIPVIAGVDFQMTDGSPAIYAYDDPYLPEFGPDGFGGISNFYASGYPYPDLSLLFEAPISTLAFAMRASPIDDVQVTFFLDGAMVDQLTLPTRGSDQLYFYGFYNPGGFDEVVIDVLANSFRRTGAFTFDNLTFDGSDGDATAELSCVGFESPVDRASVKKSSAKKKASRKKKASHKKKGSIKKMRAGLPRSIFTARLLDADGFEITGADLVAPPVVRVFHALSSDEEEVDVTTQVVDGGADQFTAQEDGSWSIKLDRRHLRGPGDYRVSMESGDDLEYIIEPTCESQIMRRR